MGAVPKHVVLVGMMGAGKSAVGRRVAARLVRPFSDSDTVVEDRVGRTVGEIWRHDGEAAFRRLEAEALQESLADPTPAVIAAAGGTVMDAGSRAALLADDAVVIWLRADPAILLGRVRHGDHRPLLEDDPAGVLARLNDERAALYDEVSDVVIDVDDLDLDEVAARVLEEIDRVIRVPVPLPDQPYDVLVGAGARHRLLEVLPVGAERAAVVTQADIGVPVDPGVEHEVFLLDDGEEAKSLESVEELCRRFSRWGLTRRDVVVTVGGGVVTDTAGFAAAVYHRGVRVVHVPTTLLGQVDAAIGGKTGVNLPEGKNLVGAFWQPSAVLCDTEVLATLPPREYTSGLGEMAKYHFLTGIDMAGLPLDERVAECVRIKAELVVRDDHRARRPGPPQLRPHPGPRPGDRWDLRPAPWRGGGHRPRVRRRLARAPGAHRRRPGGRAPPGDRGLRPAHDDRRRPGPRCAGRPHASRQEGVRRPDLRARRTPGP